MKPEHNEFIIGLSLKTHHADITKVYMNKGIHKDIHIVYMDTTFFEQPLWTLKSRKFKVSMWTLQKVYKNQVIHIDAYIVYTNHI